LVTVGVVFAQPPLAVAGLVAGAGLLVFGTWIGTRLGAEMTHAGQLWPVVIVAAAADLWSVLASGDCPTHLAIASRGSSITAADQVRLEDMAGQHGLTIHRVEGGHWLHVDAADVLVDLVAQSLS